MKIKELIKRNKHHILESLLFSVIAALINYFIFPYAPLFEGFVLNPYLLIPLLLALRYGSLRGTVDFVITILIGMYTCHLLGHTEYLYSRDGWLFIIGTMLSAQLAGVISDKMKDQLESLKLEYDGVVNKCDNLLEINSVLSEANRELSKRIVTRFDSLNTCYEAAQKLETLNRRELFPATLDILKNHVMVNSASIYLLQDDELVFENACDTIRDRERPQKLMIDNGMIAEALKRKLMVSFLPFIEGKTKELPDEQNGDYLAVAPFFVKEEIAGVIILEEMAFLNFTRASVRMLDLVSEWVSLAMEKIVLFQDVEDKVPDDPAMYGFKARFMKHTLLLELSKAIRYGLDLSVMKIWIKDRERYDHKVLADLSMLIGYILKNQKRDIDFLGSSGKLGSYMIILPVTDRSGMTKFSERLIEEVKNFPFKSEEQQNVDFEIDVLKVSLYDLIAKSDLEKIKKGSISSKARELHEMILKSLEMMDES